MHEIRLRPTHEKYHIHAIDVVRHRRNGVILMKKRKNIVAQVSTYRLGRLILSRARVYIVDVRIHQQGNEFDASSRIDRIASL